MLVAVLAVTSGAFAAQHYLITSSSQIKDGAVSDVRSLARRPQGAAAAEREQGHRGPAGTSWPSGPEGRHRRRRYARQGRGARQGRQGRRAGFSPTAFGPYASDSPDSSICGNDWANDKIGRSYVVYPQLDGSFLMAETFTNGTFTTVAGNSPQDNKCGSSEDDVAGGHHRHDEGLLHRQDPRRASATSIPRPSAQSKCYTKDFVQAVFGTDSYDVPVFEMHYSSLGHGSWKNASPNRGGNSGNIN